MTDEINLRFNSLNTELVGSFDSFAGVQSDYKRETEKALNEMLRVRNQVETMDKQLAKDFKTLAERVRDLESNVLHGVFDSNHKKAINLQSQVHRGGKSEGQFPRPISPSGKSLTSLPLLNERRIVDIYGPNQQSAPGQGYSHALPLTSKSELLVPQHGSSAIKQTLDDYNTKSYYYNAAAQYNQNLRQLQPGSSHGRKAVSIGATPDRGRVVDAGISNDIAYKPIGALQVGLDPKLGYERKMPTYQNEGRSYNSIAQHNGAY